MKRRAAAVLDAESPEPVPSSMALSLRLLLAITAAACCTLAIAVWYIDGAMQRGLIHEHQEILADHLSAVRRAVAQDPEGLSEARDILTSTIGGDKNEKSYGRLAAPDGKVLIETPDFSSQSPPLAGFPPPVSATAHEAPITVMQNPEGNPVFVAAAAVSRPGGLAPLTYYMTADAVPEMHLMRDFRLELVGVIVCGALLSAVLAWVISRRGLKPLNEIAAHIESTTAEALQHGDQAKAGPAQRRWPRELARLASSFQALRARLSRSFHQLRQFSDDAAHEIRSPLNNMLSLASFTLQKHRSPEEYREALESTVEECERLRKLADGLLFIARADHRRTSLTVAPFDAATAIQEVVDYHEEAAREKGITLEVHAAGSVEADRTLFRQALTNLLSNAIRHTGTDGRIVIRYGPAAPAGSIPGGVLSVSDTGEGIAGDHLPRIFDRFYRVDAARSGDSSGSVQTGLGLAIVKAILEIHGGSIRAASEPGKGTEFTLWWPARPLDQGAVF